MTRFFTLMIGGLVVVFSCSVLARQVVVPNGADVAQQIQKAVIDAKPGDEIILPAGEFKLLTPISLFEKRIKLKGQGIGKTILNFSLIEEGGQGVLIRNDNVSLSDLSIKNTPGDGVVARGVRNIELKNIEVKWDPGFSSGGYGLYPVQSYNVLVSGCTVSGAREAGIYLGQSKTAILKGNTVFKNVVGIDIENSSYVEVIDNTVRNNSVGITVVGRPYLLVTNPRSVTIDHNRITSNNLYNFASKESLAAAMGSGYAIKVLSTKKVSIDNNEFHDHEVVSIYVADFPVLGREYEGEMTFDPFVRGIELGVDQFGESKMHVAHSKLSTLNLDGLKQIDVWLDRLTHWARRGDKVCFHRSDKVQVLHYGLLASKAAENFDCK